MELTNGPLGWVTSVGLGLPDFQTRRLLLLTSGVMMVTLDVGWIEAFE